MDVTADNVRYEFNVNESTDGTFYVTSALNLVVGCVPGYLTFYHTAALT